MPGEVEIGQVLNGKYAIERFVGAGGMAEVYLATNQLVGRPVAIKLLRHEVAQQHEARERFLREARAAGTVRHRNIVDILDVDGLADGSMYIVQEFLEGEDLAARIRRGRLSADEALCIMLPVAEAVSHAHKQGIVHRDLKPDNVFLAEEEDELIPKVLDFGISKLPLHDEIRRSVNEPAQGRRLTAAGAAMGTPYYMSPEQIRDPSSVGTATDVWAIGVILFEALAGEMPFDAEKLAGLFGLICSGKAPSLSRVAPDVPKALSKVVGRCLLPNPEARYRDAGALARALAEVQSELSGDAPPDRPRRPSLGAMAAEGESRRGRPRRRNSRKVRTYDPNRDPRSAGGDSEAPPDDDATTDVARGAAAFELDFEPSSPPAATSAAGLEFDLPAEEPSGSSAAPELELDLPPAPARKSAPAATSSPAPRASAPSSGVDLLGTDDDDWDAAGPLQVELDGGPPGMAPTSGAPSSPGAVDAAASGGARAAASAAPKTGPRSRRVQVRRHAEGPPDYSIVQRVLRIGGALAVMAAVTLAGQLLTPAGLTELDRNYGASSFLPLLLGTVGLLVTTLGVGRWALRLPSIPLFVTAAANIVLVGAAGATTALVASPGLVPVTLRKAVLLASPYAAIVALAGLAAFAASVGREMWQLEQKPWAGVMGAGMLAALVPLGMLAASPFPDAEAVATIELGPRASALSDPGAELGAAEVGAAILPRRKTTPRSPSPLGPRKQRPPEK